MGLLFGAYGKKVSVMGLFDVDELRGGWSAVSARVLVGDKDGKRNCWIDEVAKSKVNCEMQLWSTIEKRDGKDANY